MILCVCPQFRVPKCHQKGDQFGAQCTALNELPVARCVDCSEGFRLCVVVFLH